MLSNTIPLFYNDNLITVHLLEGSEAHHLTNVLRLRRNAEIQITDGKGNMALATVSNVAKHHVEYTIKEITETAPLPYKLHLAVAPTKNIERYEIMIEKCTELGFSELTPIFCEHSERTVVKTDRLNKIMIAAAKQSLKTYFPKINPPMKFNELISNTIYTQDKLIALCSFENRKSLIKAAQKSKEAIVLIGPEGDFSATEINMALQNGYQPITLGNSRLRTETAAIAACHTYYLIN